MLQYHLAVRQHWNLQQLPSINPDLVEMVGMQDRVRQE